MVFCRILQYLSAKSVCLGFTLFCREICFGTIYALLCGEKFSRKLCPWRKNDKYEVWSSLLSLLVWICAWISFYFKEQRIIEQVLPHEEIAGNLPMTELRRLWSVHKRKWLCNSGNYSIPPLRSTYGPPNDRGAGWCGHPSDTFG